MKLSTLSIPSLFQKMVKRREFFKLSVKLKKSNPELFEDFTKIGINNNRVVIYPIIIYTGNSLQMYGVKS
jgi:hypothetical protein